MANVNGSGRVSVGPIWFAVLQSRHIGAITITMLADRNCVSNTYVGNKHRKVRARVMKTEVRRKVIMCNGGDRCFPDEQLPRVNDLITGDIFEANIPSDWIISFTTRKTYWKLSSRGLCAYKEFSEQHCLHSRRCGRKRSRGRRGRSSCLRNHGHAPWISKLPIAQ